MTDPRVAEIALPEPFTYAHRYHYHFGGTVIRFETNGCEINGGAPIEAIPVYLGNQVASLLASLQAAQAEVERLRKAGDGLQSALKLALEYWRHRQQRYKNRHPTWVIAANNALAAAGEREA